VSIQIIDDGYVPVRVTAHLTEPIVYALDGMHLDGILAAAAYRDLDERTRRRIPPLSADWVIDLRLPLARWAVDVGDAPVPDGRLLWKHSDGREVWGWCASVEVAEWLGQGVAEVRKKPVLDEMRRYSEAKSAQINGGPLKGYNLRMPTAFARSVSWHALGDPVAIARLLDRHIGAIGKKRGHGWGTVARWEVEQIDTDQSIARDGVLARRLPAQCGIVGRPVTGAIRPPYHHRSRRVHAVEPAC